MFGKKKKEQLEKLFASLMPEPVVSIAKIGGDKLVDDVLVDFVLLLIEESDLLRFGSLCSQSIEIANNHHALVVANVGGLLQLAVGPRFDSADCKVVREKLVSDLISSLGQSVRIVHGRARSRVGAVGTDARRTWGYFPVAIFPILQALSASISGIPTDLGDLQ